MSVEDRFAAYINKPDGEGGCWEWIGSLRPNGYGQVSAFGQTRLAHRVSWRINYGSFPVADLRHLCNNRRCVNVSHLREGTAAENAVDRILTGNHLHAERIHGSVLTASDIKSIVDQIATGYSDAEIAGKFSVHKRTINDVRRGKTWRREQGLPPLVSQLTRA